MQQWVEHTGIDGFNLERYLLPGAITDFVDYVVPELQRRSMFRAPYEEDSLRERLFGAGKTKLPRTHPGARFRKKDGE